jgi:hypothetical protein
LPFLNHHFPLGIDGEKRNAYLFYALQSLYKALKQYPLIKTLKRKKNSQKSEDDEELSDQAFREMIKNHFQSAYQRENIENDMEPIKPL